MNFLHATVMDGNIFLMLRFVVGSLGFSPKEYKVKTQNQIYSMFTISPPAVQHHLPFVNILNYTVLRLRPMFSTPTAS